ncbi:restriction endonuclease subunit S [Winogradskyella pacifica]|uniref:restriction endonuclease subunit S n=1 Tax=Winogradskyella pacifica TaxID=664642 RepID=UPI0015CC398F|nr:restriction endonuclease subunit S [Winogradskyella pacifica]
MRLKLEDNCTFINGGSWTANEYADSGYPVLKVSNFDKASISYNELSYLQESSFGKYKKNELKLHDIVIATVGSHPSLINSAAGRCITVPKDAVGLLLNQNALCLRSNNLDFIDQRYLGYLCKSQLFQHFIQQRGKGAANQMRIPIGGIKSFEIDFPEIETQRKIASILSGYDDLIENNLKRIKLLEEQAQQTYEEWFVRFKFPGYEDVDIDAVSGLPVGWDLKKLNEVSKINSKSLKKDFKGKIKYIDIASVSIGKIDSTTTYGFSEAPGRAKRIVQHGDIIWSCVRPNRKSHSVIWNPEDNLIASTGFCVISPKSLPTSYLLKYLTTDSFVAYLTNLAGGAAYPAVKAIDFKDADVVVPSKNLLDKFDNKFRKVLEVSNNLQNQNQHLKEARDILLPRLMSGMIDLNSLEVNEGLGMVAEDNEKY